VFYCVLMLPEAVLVPFGALGSVLEPFGALLVVFGRVLEGVWEGF
jgi:hypothetical protein